MTKKAKRIISIVIVSIILISTAVLIISCSAVKEYEYKYLKAAYEAGWITEDDLQTLADYWNNDRTLPEMQYSQNVVNNIKYTHFNENIYADDSLRSKYLFSKNKHSISMTYYGTYNGYVVVYIIGGPNIEDFFPKDITIGGVTFYKFRVLKVYKVNS